MKRISPALFDELRRTASNISTGWRLEREDGVVIGFTASDTGFVYDGVEYEPINTFSGSAATSKNNLSVDNMTVLSIITERLTRAELLGGKWDNAYVQFFWIRPDKPEWGVVPIRGGRLGEITCKGHSFETELRSIIQALQQPFGEFYTLECSADFGDAKCKMVLDAPTWSPETYYIAKITGEAGIGDVVKPTVANGFWYEMVNGPNTVSSATQQGLTTSGLWDKLEQVRIRNGIN